MKAYISADLRVINISANDIVTASPESGFSTQGISSMGTAGRRDMFDDSYDEF